MKDKAEQKYLIRQSNRKVRKQIGFVRAQFQTRPSFASDDLRASTVNENCIARMSDSTEPISNQFA